VLSTLAASLLARVSASPSPPVVSQAAAISSERRLAAVQRQVGVSGPARPGHGGKVPAA